MRLPTKWLINNSIPATAARLRKFSSAIEFMRIAGTVFDVLMRGHLLSGPFSCHLREVARRMTCGPIGPAGKLRERKASGLAERTAR